MQVLQFHKKIITLENSKLESKYAQDIVIYTCMIIVFFLLKYKILREVGRGCIKN